MGPTRKTGGPPRGSAIVGPTWGVRKGVPQGGHRGFTNSGSLRGTPMRASKEVDKWGRHGGPTIGVPNGGSPKG
jgi:hypothetical protein